jgi:lipopolysaccharide transport system ATP-binding protein
MSRIYQPSAGTVSIAGRVSPFLELGVGFNPELTARENIYLNGAVLGLSRQEIGDRIEHIIDFAGPQVRSAAEQKVKNYSSGMQVRLAFSVAIQADADVLLMDEVLAVGDAEFQAKCFDVFERYRREGKTVVLVTHDLGSVEQYCDRAILIESGKVVVDGRASDVTGLYRRNVGLARSEVPDTVEQSEEGSRRWGSGELEITEVAFVRADGTVTRNFTSDQPMTVRIRYRVISDVGEFACAVAVHRGDGMPLTSNNTHISGLRLVCPPVGESGEIRYAIPALPLLRGQYRATVSLHALHNVYPYDHHEQAHEFDVNDESCRGGFLELGGGWEADGVVERVQPPTQADMARVISAVDAPEPAQAGESA